MIKYAQWGITILAVVFALFFKQKEVVVKTETVVEVHTDSIYLPDTVIQDRPIHTIREKVIYDTVTNEVVRVETDTVYMDTCHVYQFTDSSNHLVNLTADFDLCRKNAHFVYTSKFELPRYSLFSVGAGYLTETRDPFIYTQMRFKRMQFGVIKSWDNWGVYTGWNF